MLEAKLTSIYKQVMWLARQPEITPANARGWYTHVVSARLRRDVRRFTGEVSKQALKEGATLRLEHFKRIQTELTKLITRHLKEVDSAKEFVKMVIDYEQVHIVTLKENYEAMKAKGDYKKAGIELIKWKDIPHKKQNFLWGKMLRGKVSNANEFSH